MSVQAVREEIARFKGIELVLTNERRKEFLRADKWDQARTVEMWLGSLVWFIERAYMAAGSKPKPKSEYPEFKGYVNYVLSEGDKTAYSGWDVDDHDLWLLIAGHQQCGYKLSVSFNPKNDTFNATYICNDLASPNAGYCLSAFAPDWYNAVKVLAFKHDIVLDGVWKGENAKEANLWG